MDVAQNKVPLTVYASGPDCALRSFIPSDDVGYEPEVRDKILESTARSKLIDFRSCIFSDISK